MNLVLTIARIAASLAVFGVCSAVMVWVLGTAAQAWVGLYNAIQGAGGYLAQPAAFMGWIAWVIRLDYAIAVALFCAAYHLLIRLWWFIKGVA